MKYVDEYRNNEQVQALLRAIRKVTTRPWHIMEICGGQTHAIARYRLEEMLPQEIRLLHGPGCPVCVTPVSLIDQALELAGQSDIILASFGDMMRVPGTKEDLLQAKAHGADVRMLYSRSMRSNWRKQIRRKKLSFSPLALKQPPLFI